MKENFKILALSGGGVRGILTASILQRLESEKAFISKVDLFAGTSTGSFIAAGLASGRFSVEEIIQLYIEGSEGLFKRDFSQKLTSIFGLYKSKYTADGLWRFSQKLFGDLKLKDLPKRILIPALDLGGNGRGFRAKFFDNFKDSYDLDLKLSDVVVASCSGPTYFPAHTIDHPGFGKRRYCDGGTVCNHPCVAAIASVVGPSNLGITIDQIACLAITTGYYPRNVSDEWTERGIIGWAREIIDVLTEQRSVAEYQSSRILLLPNGPRYYSINPELPTDIKLDDVSEMARLKRIGHEYPITFAGTWIARNFLNDFNKKDLKNINKSHQSISIGENKL